MSSLFVRRPWGTLVVAALTAVLVVILLWPTMASSSGEDGTQALQRRVEALERTVSRDPFQPRRTLLARMEAAEGRLQALERRPAVERVAVELEQFRRESRAMDQRLQRMEQGLQRAGAADQREVRDLQRQVTELNRSITDLQRRVQRLERSR